MLGDALRTWRQRRGWSQRDLAAEAGLPQSYVSMLETGRRHGTVETYKLLAKAMAISFEELVKLAGEPVGDELPDVSVLPREIRWLIRHFGQDLDAADLRAILEYAEGRIALKRVREGAAGYHAPDLEVAPAEGENHGAA